MNEDILNLEKELKFIEESFNTGIITHDEYESAKKRVTNQLENLKKEEKPPESTVGKEKKSKKAGDEKKEMIKEGEEVPLNPSLKEPDKDEQEEKKDETLDVKEDSKLSEGIKSHDSARKQAIEHATEKKQVGEEKKPIEESHTKPLFSGNFKTFVFLAIIVIIFIYIFSLRSNNQQPATIENIEEQAPLPACEYDLDCQKTGFVGQCINPGTEKAECIYEERAQAINITIIDSEECGLCNSERMKNTLKQLYPGANYLTLDQADPNARLLISNLDIEALPAYIFDSSVENTKRFNATATAFTKSTLVKSGNYYLMKPVAAGSVYFFKRPKISEAIELYLNPYIASSQDAFFNLLEFSKKTDSKVSLRYFSRKENSQQRDELITQVCIRSQSDQKLLDYLECILSKGITVQNSKSCQEKANVQSTQLDQCVIQEGESLLQLDYEEAESLSINTVPVFVFNNQYKKGGSMSPDMLEEIYCNLNRCTS